MAKNSVNIDAQCAKILSDVRAGRFSPVHLLMGDEPYYPEMVCDAIVGCCIPEEEKDFNETVCYGGEVTAAQVVTAARRYPSAIRTTPRSPIAKAAFCSAVVRSRRARRP